MNSKVRVLSTLKGEKTDRVPLFYRDTPEVEKRLLKDLKLKDREELLQCLNIDFRWVGPEYIGPKLSIDDNRKFDIWGIKYKYVKTKTGGYWENVSFPLLNVEDIDFLEDYQWPSIDWFDFSVLDEQLERYKDYAIMTAPGHASPGLLAVIQELIGMERALTDMLLNPEFYYKLSEKILGFQQKYVEKLFEAAKGRIDFFRIGDDYGTQRSLLMSPLLWKEFMQPYLITLSKNAKRNGAYYYHHSCGAVSKLIPLFIETGVDVLDPLQVKAEGMKPESLKKQYGDKICFSGGVDTQDLLVNGEPKDVENYVNWLLDIMAPGGRFFIGPSHNFQGDVPTENILAMYKAASLWKSF
jgi:uroporphyrinogen decarboxylase